MNMEASLGLEPRLNEKHFALLKPQQEHFKGVKVLTQELVLGCARPPHKQTIG